MYEDLKEKCIRLEHYETPIWAAKAILQKEYLKGLVIDPCCGTGVLAQAALNYGHDVYALDIEQWGYESQNAQLDWLGLEELNGGKEFDVMMNPPFSLATQFVEKAFELGARKVLCFQRFAWWESKKRREFWRKYQPSRVYICGDRADCWRHDIHEAGRGSSSPTAHAWFVFEKGERNHWPLLSHVWKDDVK